jgi:hypothetical protein
VVIRKKSTTAKVLPAKLTVDFSGVSDGGGGRSSHMPEGDYLFKVIKAMRKKKNNADTEYVSWQLKAIKGPGMGTIFHVTSLKPEQLWSFRNFLQDLTGKEVPTKSLNIDLDKYKGYVIGATVVDDEPYEGKDKSKIDSTFPKADYSEDEEEVSPVKATKKITATSKKKVVEEEEEEEEEEEDEDAEETEEEEEEDEDEDELEVDDL